MSSRRRKSEPDPLWTYSYGAKPHTVNAYERPERGHQVWVRWRNAQKSEREKREKRSLGLRVRDLHSGRLDPQLVRAAERAVQKFQAELLTGIQQATLTAARVEPSPPEPPALTLKEGFDLALHPSEGKYPSTSTRRFDQMLKYRARLFDSSGNSPSLIDPSLSWIELDAKLARATWRKMAVHYVATGGAEFGLRAA